VRHKPYSGKVLKANSGPNNKTTTQKVKITKAKQNLQQHLKLHHLLHHGDEKLNLVWQFALVIKLSTIILSQIWKRAKLTLTKSLIAVQHVGHGTPVVSS